MQFRRWSEYGKNYNKSQRMHGRKCVAINNKRKKPKKEEAPQRVKFNDRILVWRKNDDK